MSRRPSKGAFSFWGLTVTLMMHITNNEKQVPPALAVLE